MTNSWGRTGLTRSDDGNVEIDLVGAYITFSAEIQGEIEMIIRRLGREMRAELEEKSPDGKYYLKNTKGKHTDTAEKAPGHTSVAGRSDSATRRRVRAERSQPRHTRRVKSTGLYICLNLAIRCPTAAASRKSYGCGDPGKIQEKSSGRNKAAVIQITSRALRLEADI